MAALDTFIDTVIEACSGISAGAYELAEPRADAQPRAVLIPSLSIRCEFMSKWYGPACDQSCI